MTKRLGTSELPSNLECNKSIIIIINSIHGYRDAMVTRKNTVVMETRHEILQIHEKVVKREEKLRKRRRNRERRKQFFSLKFVQKLKA